MVFKVLHTLPILAMADTDKMNRQGAKDAKGNSITMMIHNLPDVGCCRNGLYHFFAVFSF